MDTFTEVMNPIKLPISPNSLTSKEGKDYEGDFQLMSFGSFDFVQNVRFQPPLMIYDEYYQNEVSHSEFSKNHLHTVYSIIKSHFPNGGKLVEVGCGKGAFLNIVKSDKHFEYEGYDTAYEGSDTYIHSLYLTEDDRINADIVVLRHTLGHIQSPHKFLKLLNIIFGDDALIFIEVPQFDWIKVNRVLFDLSYEDVNYFSTKSLCSLFSNINDCGDFFEGQYQYCLAKLGALSEKEWSEFELTSKWFDFNVDDFYENFNSSVDFLNNKKRIWIWGGGTNGILFLKHLSNLRPLIFEKIVGVVDINPKKQLFFTPSTKIRIISDFQMHKESEEGDVVLVMNPNYYGEIVESIGSALSHTVEIHSI